MDLIRLSFSNMHAINYDIFCWESSDCPMNAASKLIPNTVEACAALLAVETASLLNLDDIMSYDWIVINVLSCRHKTCIHTNYKPS